MLIPVVVEVDTVVVVELAVVLEVVETVVVDWVVKTVDVDEVVDTVVVVEVVGAVGVLKLLLGFACVLRMEVGLGTLGFMSARSTFWRGGEV